MQAKETKYQNAEKERKTLEEKLQSKAMDCFVLGADAL
jgi:hypothetical protein